MNLPKIILATVYFLSALVTLNNTSFHNPTFFSYAAFYITLAGAISFGVSVLANKR